MNRILLLSFVYFVSGWLGLKIPYTGSHITLLWLPTGIAVAALFRWGVGVWPGVYLGAFLVNLSIGSSLSLAAGIAAGNTLGPILSAMILGRIKFHPDFTRQMDVGFFNIAASVGMTVSAGRLMLCLLEVLRGTRRTGWISELPTRHVWRQQFPNWHAMSFSMPVKGFAK